MTMRLPKAGAAAPSAPELRHPSAPSETSEFPVEPIGTRAAPELRHPSPSPRVGCRETAAPERPIWHPADLDGELAPVVVVLPIRTLSEMNQRTHWSVRARRMKAHRTAAALAVGAALRAPLLVLGAVDVTITRIAPRALDTDNLAASAKGVRDGIADALGIDDRDSRARWFCDQRKGAVREHAVEIRITRRGTP